MKKQEHESEFNDNDWESLPATHNHHPSSSTHKLPPLQTTLYHHHHHLSIFPPDNHENLPIPPHAPLSSSNFNSDNDSPSLSPSPPPNPASHFIKWFDFALHIWNSKLHSSFTLLRSRRYFFSLLPVAATASFLALLWFWLRRRRRLRSLEMKESVENLKLVIKEKDEKIFQLLEQIALMNKVLLARYRVPVLKAS